MKYLVKENYRDRWSELPEGEFDLYKGDIVEMINNPGIGSIHVRRDSDSADVYVAGFKGYILSRIEEKEMCDKCNYPVDSHSNMCTENIINSDVYQYRTNQV